jgi:hypothetical protein
MAISKVTALSHDFTRKLSIIMVKSRTRRLCIKSKVWFRNKSSRHISDNTKCPVNPNSNLTWGECFANVKHKTNGDKDTRHQGKLKKDKMDSNAAHIGNDDVSITSKATSLGTLDSLSTASEPCRQRADNNNMTVSTVTNGIGMFAELCLDFNKR